MDKENQENQDSQENQEDQENQKKQGNQYWKVPIDEKISKQLDLELIEEINDYYGEEDEEEEEIPDSWVVKLIGFVTVVVFILLILATGFRAFNMPPLEFLTHSRELAMNPEIRELRESVVVVNSVGSQGTGFNIDPTGLIITNYHVISGARIVSVNFISGDLYHIRDIESFPELDIALLRFEGSDIPTVELETERVPQFGDEVLIIGNPMGFARIIKEGRIVGTTRLSGWDSEVLMIEGDIHQGSSGSPVFNDEGKVIAVIFATLRADVEGVRTVGLAVPIKEFLEKLHVP